MMTTGTVLCSHVQRAAILTCTLVLCIGATRVMGLLCKACCCRGGTPPTFPSLPPSPSTRRYYKISSPTFRMVMKAGKPVFLQIGGESIIRHATVHIIRVRQVGVGEGEWLERGGGQLLLLLRCCCCCTWLLHMRCPRCCHLCSCLFSRPSPSPFPLPLPLPLLHTHPPLPGRESSVASGMGATL
jgi:hypothetical protein